MITELLMDNFYFSDRQLSWQEAICLAANPLLNKGAITQNYINDVIKNIEINGSYIVLVPEIALPHARSNGNVLQTAMSFLKLTHPVTFPDGMSVTVMFFLASTDSDGHLDVLVELAEILADKNNQNLFRTAKKQEQILAILNQPKQIA
ncbi:PTS sugar transporter subunit IIA [Orbus sturtevantii]|uniref:PTS sugar transporter subunit IIA n=1 Tax=Orbus sturtevantii TaxID=3074109 RepID=UPI00370DA17F